MVIYEQVCTVAPTKQGDTEVWSEGGFPMYLSPPVVYVGDGVGSDNIGVL